MKRFHALILAKGSSRRLKNKNTLDFHGKPMFLVNVEKCLRNFEKVYVSSDDRWILKMASQAGAIAIHRDESLCGETPNIPCYRHAILKMPDADGIVAIQANSPTLDVNTITMVKKFMELGVPEVMTCHEDYSIYGSVWAVSKERLADYGDPYDPHPEVLIMDKSVDVHNLADYEKALCQQ